MAQASISSYFIAKKRGIEDDVISNKKKVICLERNRNLSESQADSDDLETVVVYPKGRSNITSDDAPKNLAQKTAMRQGVTPQRRTRSKKIVHMQEVDGIEAPKVANFWKGGNLSPQKKAKVAPSVECPEAKAGFTTPIKKNVSANDAIENTVLISNNTMNLDEIKRKLKGSTKLTDLKTSLNKLNSGFDKLSQMESKRIAKDVERGKRAESPATPKSLKPFKCIELEILR